MASVSRIVALDIGSHSVKLGEFLVPKEGYLTLSRYATAPLGLDPNKEEDRHQALTQVVKQLLATSGIKPHTKVAFSVGGHAVFMRSVKLPAVDALQIEQMIAFEAQQIVPFPLNEVVWDFQVFTEREGSAEKEAIIVAMKSDLIESEAAAVQAAGLETEMIDIGPLALYNAYRYNYIPNEACTLLIDFGARSTNLLFIEDQRFYARFLPLAGNTVSQTICNEFQEPFNVAELLKIQRGGVNLGGDYALPEDRDTARLWRLIRNVMNRLHTEINRSIIFYRNQQGGSSPVEILITGGTSQLPYIENFLSERFGVPVRKFNPFQNISFSSGVDVRGLSPIASTFGEVVGLALRASGGCPVEVSLIPPTIAAKKEAARQKPTVYVALVACFLVFAVLIGDTLWQLAQTKTQGERMTAQTSELQELAVKQQPDELKYAEFSQKYALAEKVFTQREVWLRLLKDINAKIPEGMWITVLTPTCGEQPLEDEGQVKPNPKGHPGTSPNTEDSQYTGSPEINQILIHGLFERSATGVIVNDFVKALSDLDRFDIDPLKLSESIVTTQSPAQDGDQQAGTFQLRLKLKKPISPTAAFSTKSINRNCI